MNRNEAYFDILWRQFKKSREAYWSLWAMVPLYLVAIFAPAIASNQPWIFHDAFGAELDGGNYTAQLTFGKAGLKYDAERDLWIDEKKKRQYGRQQARLKIIVLSRLGPMSAENVVLDVAGGGMSASCRFDPIGQTPTEASEQLSFAVLVDETLAGAVRTDESVGAVLRIDIDGAPHAAPLGMTIFPWFRAIFNPEEEVDVVFNVVMLVFFPWVVVALLANRRWVRRGVPGRRRAGRAALLCLCLGVALYLFFLLPGWGTENRWAFRPKNKYAQRTFAAESFESGGKSHGWYPPVPLGPTELDESVGFEPPLFRKPPEQWTETNDGFLHVLGTDDSGRDVLVRMLYGTRIALTVGFVAVGIYVTIGVVIGALAGYFGGKTDMLISRIIEIVLLFPSFFLILTLVGLIGPSIYIIMIVIGVTGWPTIARLIRGEVLKQREIDYTTAARALGASHLRIVFRHILPNAVSPALVAIPFGIAGAIITEAGLSLLGFGVRPPTPTWGTLLEQGRQNYEYWWLIVVPSLAIFLVVTMFNLVGSGLRDAMDPKLRRQ